MLSAENAEVGFLEHLVTIRRPYRAVSQSRLDEATPSFLSRTMRMMLSVDRLHVERYFHIFLATARVMKRQKMLSIP